VRGYERFWGARKAETNRTFEDGISKDCNKSELQIGSEIKKLFYSKIY
jgi:hypothetical protein